MTDGVEKHYGGGQGELARKVAESLRQAGKDPEALRTADLAAFDEFHFRGRQATLELAAEMRLDGGAKVLDIGSGLGGPARCLAEAYGCHVTGVDLTAAFCAAAAELSDWVGLGERTDFRQADATELPFADDSFDAAMTIHVAMNIAAKDRLYGEARRVLKPGGRFALYDVLQGEGGEVILPVPWARERALSHLASGEETERLLSAAGFEILQVQDSSAESEAWLAAAMAGGHSGDPPPVTVALLFGADFPAMRRNQLQSLREGRMRTVSIIAAT